MSNRQARVTIYSPDSAGRSHKLCSITTTPQTVVGSRAGRPGGHTTLHANGWHHFQPHDASPPSGGAYKTPQFSSVTFAELEQIEITLESVIRCPLGEPKPGRNNVVLPAGAKKGTRLLIGLTGPALTDEQLSEIQAGLSPFWTFGGPSSANTLVIGFPRP